VRPAGAFTRPDVVRTKEVHTLQLATGEKDGAIGDCTAAVECHSDPNTQFLIPGFLRIQFLIPNS